MPKKIPTTIPRVTHEFDATDQVLGRFAVRIALLLRGKGKVSYQPHRDDGDRVVVTNVSKIKVTGKKREQKVYYSYSGYPGGLKKKKLADLLEKKPSEALRKAVYNMLPPTRLRTSMMKRLTIS